MTLDLCATDDSEDLRLVRASARGLLARDWPAARAEALAADASAMEAMWRTAAAQGWTAVDLGDDEAEGFRAGVVLLEELGRAGCPIPLLDAMLANAVLAASDDPSAAARRDALRDGMLRPTWAWHPSTGEDGGLMLDAASLADGLLQGRAAFVENASTATHLFIATGQPGEVVVLPMDTAGITITGTPGLARPALSEVTLAAVRCTERITTRFDLASIGALARLLLAARSLGAAAHGMELLVDYAQVRTQFGRPIGAYQAIQHKLADIFIGVEICRLAIHRAATDAPGRAHAAAVASANAGHLLRRAALELHHGFGGISFWQEHAMPRLFRRIHGDLTRLGGMTAARRDLAAELVDGPAGTRLPDPALGPVVDGFRAEVRDWLTAHWNGTLDPDTAHLPLNHRKARQAFSRQLGAKGWLGISWPREFGGQQRGALEQFAFEEEMAYHDAPVTFHNTAANMIGPTLIDHGSPAQKREFLGGIARGDTSFALGYSEPDHGSDLASIRTTATRTADGGWRIRGQKTFTSTAGFSTHLWTLARSNPSEPKHAGLSVFIVPLDAPGLTMQPMIGLNDHRANTVFLDDVLVPADAVVGEVDGGWTVITAALAHERMALAGIAARARGYFDRLVDTLRQAGPADALVRDRIGALAAEIEAARLLALQAATVVQAGRVPVYEAAIAKVFASELMERLAEAAFDLLGTGATLAAGSASARGEGRFEYAVRDALLYTIGGGTNEIQRTLIALRGLGLPR